MSSYDEELYKDYVARRNAEYGHLERSQPTSAGSGIKRSRELGSALPSGRFVPASQRPPSALLPEEKRSQLKGDGSYDMPNNIYHASGYVSRPSELGEDPLTAVRTLRNQIRQAAIKNREEGLPVRTRLCDHACDRLSTAEGLLAAMASDRSSALVVGNNKKAQQIGANMEKVKEDAIRDAYADLVMDKHEMRAFGVNSEWSPLRKEEPKPRTPKPGTPMPPPTPNKK